MNVKRYTHHWSSYKPSFMDEQGDGEYVRHSDYATLLTRHNALVEAVEWLQECEKFLRWVIQFNCPVTCEWLQVIYDARAEADRILSEEKK